MEGIPVSERFSGCCILAFSTYNLWSWVNEFNNLQSKFNIPTIGMTSTTSSTFYNNNLETEVMNVKVYWNALVPCIIDSVFIFNKALPWWFTFSTLCSITIIMPCPAERPNSICFEPNPTLKCLESSEIFKLDNVKGLNKIVVSHQNVSKEERWGKILYSTCSC